MGHECVQMERYKKKRRAQCVMESPSAGITKRWLRTPAEPALTIRFIKETRTLSLLLNELCQLNLISCLIQTRSSFEKNIKQLPDAYFKRRLELYIVCDMYRSK